MSPSPPPFDLSLLQALETMQRRAVRADPTDTAARLSLAWCLLLQSLFRAGQEHLLQRLAADTADAEGMLLPNAGRSAAALLGDSLRQALTARYLAGDPQAGWHADRIQALAALSGADSVLLGAQQHLAAALEALTGDLRGCAGAGVRGRSPGRRARPRPALRRRHPRRRGIALPPAG